MKKYIRPIMMTVLVVSSLFLITSCNNKKEETSAPVVTDQNDKTPTENTTEKTPGDSNTKPQELQKLTVELGNDMGKDITKLFIRATAKDEWMEIKLTGNLWQSGYLIPVEIESKTIPTPESGWNVLVEFSDSTEHLFEGVKLNSEKSIILTEEGVVY